MAKDHKALLEIAQRTRNWESYLANLSARQRTVLRALGAKFLSSKEVADKVRLPENNASAVLSRLCSLGITERMQRGYYIVVEKEFAAYLELQMIGDISKKNISNEASNLVYRAIIGLLESLEHQNLIVGNGHHMAQKLAQTAEEMVLARWKEKEEAA